MNVNDVTRRDFVKTATIAAGATALSGLPAWAVQENREPIKIGFIGCGGRGTGLVVYHHVTAAAGRYGRRMWPWRWRCRWWRHRRWR